MNRSHMNGELRITNVNEVVELREKNYELNIRYLEEKNLAYKLADKLRKELLKGGYSLNG